MSGREKRGEIGGEGTRVGEGMRGRGGWEGRIGREMVRRFCSIGVQ